MDQEIKSIVNQRYSQIAKNQLNTPNSNCYESDSNCCSNNEIPKTESNNQSCCSNNEIPKTESNNQSCCSNNEIPKTESNNQSCCSNSNSNEILSLGCDRRLLSTANISSNEIVLDLGSGPGKDLITLSPNIKSGIGIDFSKDMINLARLNADKANLTNLKFIQSDIENIPLEDNSVDVIISNCVINLHPNKLSVFKEVFRILKPSGRMIFSDMITHLSKEQMGTLSTDTYCACIGGATSIKEYLEFLETAGFVNIDHFIEYTNEFKNNLISTSYDSVIFIAYKK
jgi:arsenite methyltransferase